MYVGEIDVDVQMCFGRNVHKRTLEDLQTMNKDWEKTLSSHNTVDLTSLIQNANIQEV